MEVADPSEHACADGPHATVVRAKNLTKGVLEAFAEDVRSTHAIPAPEITIGGSVATRPKSFTAGQLERICQVLADTNEGLTGSEIHNLLRQVRVQDVDPTNTKWKRLFNALAKSQNQAQSGDRVLAFVNAALERARYQGDSATLEERRNQVNVVLLLYDGLVHFGLVRSQAS